MSLGMVTGHRNINYWSMIRNRIYRLKLPTTPGRYTLGKKRQAQRLCFRWIQIGVENAHLQMVFNGGANDFSITVSSHSLWHFDVVARRTQKVPAASQ